MQMYQLKKIGSVEINWKIVLTLLRAVAIVTSAPSAAASSPKAIPLEKVILPDITNRRAVRGGLVLSPPFISV